MWRVWSKFKKELLFIYLFVPSVAYDPEGWQKLDHKTLQNSTLLYLFIYYTNILYISSGRLYNRLQNVNGL